MKLDKIVDVQDGGVCVAETPAQEQLIKSIKFRNKTKKQKKFWLI